MDRQKITVPDRNFSVPERNYTVHARGEFIAKPRTAAKPTNSVDSITPAQAAPMVNQPVLQTAPAKSAPAPSPAPKPVSAPPPTPEVGRKVAPITSSMNTSKGVYIDNIKKPTLNNNTRLSIAPPKIDEVKAEVAKAKFEESLVDLATNSGAGNTDATVVAKDDNKNMAELIDKTLANEPTDKTGKNKKANIGSRKKRFLFW